LHGDEDAATDYETIFVQQPPAGDVDAAAENALKNARGDIDVILSQRMQLQQQKPADDVPPKPPPKQRHPVSIL
jgi:hypothetical protein